MKEEEEKEGFKDLGYMTWGLLQAPTPLAFERVFSTNVLKAAKEGTDDGR